MRSILIVVVVLNSLNAFAQKTIIRSKVVDPDGTGVPFAAIAVESHNQVGAYANDKGEFELRIPEFVKDGKLIISSLGYQKKIIAISEISNMIPLEKGSIMLREVIVTPQSELEKLGRAALKQISKNYPNKVHFQTAFYRKISTDSAQYTGLVESILWIKDPGYQRNSSEVRIEVMQARSGDDHIAIDSTAMRNINKMTANFDAPAIGSLLRTYELNLVRHYKLPYAFFNRKGKVFNLSERHTMDLEDITVESGDTIIHILLRTLLSEKMQLEETHLAIKKKDKAIVEYTRRVFDNYCVNVKFERNANGRYYLKSINSITPVFYPADRTKSYYYIESLDVTDLEFKSSKTRKRGVVQAKDLVFNPKKIPYDPEFWKAYQPTPINPDILRSLEKERLLEQQFIR